MSKVKIVSSVYDGSNVTFKVLRALGWGPQLLNLGYFFFKGPLTFLNMVPSRVRLCAKQMELVSRAVRVLDPKPSESILDVACGRGYSSYFIAQSVPGVKVMGIDLLPENISTANALYKHTRGLNYEVANASDIKVEDGTFDRVLCLEAAFHFEDKNAFLAEVFRVLKPGGKLCLLDFVWKDQKTRADTDQNMKKIVQKIWGFDDFMSLDEYRAAAKNNGFEHLSEMDWSYSVTKPLLNLFRWVGGMARYKIGRRMLTISNELLRTLSKRDWLDLVESSIAHDHVHNQAIYGVFLWQKPRS